MSIPFEAQPSWSWTNIDGNLNAAGTAGHHEGPSEKQTSVEPEEHHTEEKGAQEPPKPQKHYKPRTCRICLEEVLPSYEGLQDGISSILHPAPKVSYISEDPESGRLIRPCKCRGSQQYVHEGCLDQWRRSDPAYRSRTYWNCPTCGFKYRLERMRWRRAITSTVTQLVITFAIMMTLVFLFGFVADPIINLYLDPLDTITSIPDEGAAIFHEDADAGWVEHFLKGMASMGLLGAVKAFFAMSPWHWWNARQLMGGAGRRRRGQGGNRLEEISWTVVVIGIVTFLVAVWSWVRTWTRSTLEKAGDRVADVQGEDSSEEDEEVDNSTAPKSASAHKATPATDQIPGTSSDAKYESRKQR